jgi:hypothetical protein
MAKKRQCEDTATWQRRVDEWRRSSLSVTDFARQHGFASSTWLKWRKILGGDQATSTAVRASAAPGRSIPVMSPQAETRPHLDHCGAPVTFIELPVLPESRSNVGYGVPFEVGLRSGRRLQVPATFDPDALERLLSILEGR